MRCAPNPPLALASSDAGTLITNHARGGVTRTDIFLSYARQDRATARIIAECLKEEGLTVWWDASLHSGETFDEVIERNLKDARAVVVLWSPASVASRWVRAEATLADRRNKLVPAIIQACDRPIIFELTHTAELSGWNGDKSDVRWRTFVEDLFRLIASGEEQPAPPEGHEPEAAASSSVRPPRQPLRPGNDEVISSEAVPRTSRPRPPARLATQAPVESEAHLLEIEQGDLPEDVIVVGSTGAKIGRTAPADIVLPHGSVSREHCIIGMANDVLLVTDLNSTNGTFIDDVRISRATILPVGSVLRVGEISMRHAVRADAANAQRGQLQNSSGGRGGHMGRFAAAS